MLKAPFALALVLFAWTQIAAGPAQGALHIVPSSGDAWLKEAAPDDNFGSEALLSAKSKPTDGMRPVLQFDLSHLKPGITVASATLHLYVETPDDTGLPIRLHRATAPWLEAGATWNTTGGNYALAPVYASFSAPIQGTIPIDVTSLVQDWVNGTHPNHGLMLIPSSNDTESKFASREWGREIEEPRLEITTFDSADLALDKKVDKAFAAEGDTVTFVITLTNDGPSDATGIDVLDALPAGLSFVESETSQGTYAIGTGVWSVGTIVQGRDASLLLRAVIDPGTEGSMLTNVAAIIASDPLDPAPGNDADSVDVTVESSSFRIATGTYTGDNDPNRPFIELGFSPDVVLIKSADAQAPALATSTMPPNTAKQVGLKDPLVSGRILSLDADGFTVGADIEVNAFGLDYYWVAFEAAPGVLDVGSYPGNENDNRLIPTGFEPGYVIVVSDLNESAMQRFADEAVDESMAFFPEDEKGDRIQAFEPTGFQVGKHNTVNENGAQLHYIAFKSTPGQMHTGTYLGTGFTPQDILAPGFEPHYALLKVDTNNTGAVQRPASMPGSLSVPVYDNVIFSGGIIDLLPSGFRVGTSFAVNDLNETFYYAAFRDNTVPDLNVSKTVDDSTPREGQLITFAVGAKNTGAGKAHGVEITDLLLAGLTYDHHSLTQGTYDDVTGLWNVGDVASGGSAELMLTARVDLGTGGQLIGNLATVTALEETDPNPSNDSAVQTVLVQSADLAVSKVVDDNTPNEGQYLEFTVTVTNQGPFDADAIEVADLLPTGLEYDWHYPEQGTYDPGTGVWDLGLLPTGGSTNMTIGVLVDPGTAGTSLVNTAAVTGSDQPDPNSANDADSVSMVVQGADLVLTKSVNEPFPTVGDAITYTVSLTNNGPNIAYSVKVTDILPGGVSFSSDSATQGSYASGSGQWNLGTAAVGVTHTLTIVATVDTGTEGTTITNTAAVTGADQAEYAPGDESDSADVTVRGADLLLTKSVDTATPAEGDTVTFTITLTNQGPDSTAGVEVTDLLPAGLTYLSDTPSLGSYVSGTGIWTVGALATAASATLTLEATVDLGTDGTVITNTATVTASDLSDPDTANDSDDAVITVLASDFRMATGWYWGNGLPTQTINDAGFQPDLVLIKGSGPTGTSAATSTMPPDASKPMGGAPLPLESNRILSLDAEGFTVGGSSRVNAFGTTYYWTAFKAGTGAMHVGTYPGDGGDQRDIPDVGFEPGYMMILGENAQPAQQRFAGQAEDASSTFGADAELPDRILLFNPDGFQIGTDFGVNEPGVTYHYVAWRSKPGATTTGTYLGNGTRPHDITDPSFEPQYVLLKSADASYGGTQRNASIFGEWTLPVSNDGMFLDGIVDFLPGGFQLGSSFQTNNAGSDYYWVAFRDVTSPDLAVTKVVDDPTPTEGQMVTFTVTLTNAGAADGNGIQIEDLLPPGLSHDFDSTTQGSYDDGTGVWDVGTLVPGASATLTLDTVVDFGTAGTVITNTASVSALDEPDPNLANDSDSADVAVQSADLAVIKTVDDSQPNEGGEVTFFVTVTNQGPSAADNVELTDVLPAGLTYMDDLPGQGSYDPGTGIWDLGTLGSGVGALLQISATVDAGTAGTTLVNSAMVTASSLPDPVANNDQDSASVTVRSVDLALTKTVDIPEPGEGQTVTYRVRVSNAGPDGASLVEITDLLPTGVTLQLATASRGTYTAGTGVWNVGALANGASATLDLEVTVDAGTVGNVISNRADLTAVLPVDIDPANDAAAVDITVRGADLVLTKIVDNATPTENDTITFTLELTNGGPDDAADVEVTDLLPTGLDFVSANAGDGAYDDGTGLWSITALPVATPVTLEIAATVLPGTGGTTITNTATATASGPSDPVDTNDSDAVDVNVQSVDLAIDKIVDETSPAEGTLVTYTVTLENLGPNLATNVAVADTVPTGLTYVSDTTTRGSYDSVTGIWTIGDVANAASETLTLTARVDAGTGGSLIANTAMVASVDQADDDTSNDTATVAITVEATDLSVSKTVDNAAPTEGETAVYTIVVTNEGPSPATGIELTDVLEAELSFRSATATQGSYVAATGLWTVGNLEPSASATLDLTVTPIAGTTGQVIANTASVTAVDQIDPNATNDTDSVDIAVAGADLAVAQAVDDDNPDEGDQITFSIDLVNDSTNEATNVRVTDLLPSGLTYADDTPSQGTYVSPTGVWFVGTLPGKQVASLTIDATVNFGSAGRILTNTAVVTGLDQNDPDASNDSSAVDIVIGGADLTVAKTADAAEVQENGTFTYTIAVTNLGPSSTSGVEVTDVLPAQVAFGSSEATHGSYAQGTGLWTVGDLAADSTATLDLTVQARTGTGGSTFTNSASVTASQLRDPDDSNDVGSVDVTVREPRNVTITAAAQTGAPLLPGESSRDLFQIVLRNDGSQIETMTSLTLHDASEGAGDTAELDANWAPLRLIVSADPVVIGTEDFTSVSFVNGVVKFAPLSVPVSPDGEVTLTVRGGASLVARDGDVLDMILSEARDLEFESEVVPGGTWPLDPPGAFAVDGMAAAQITVDAIPNASLMTNSRRNLALNFVVPANGYQSDLLERLNVVNLGTAETSTDIELLEAWSDDGDDVFDPARDFPLGEFLYTGNRWELTNILRPVPLSGLRVFVTVNIAELAAPGGTIDLALPNLPDVGVGMVSDNDGPLDRTVRGPAEHVITAADRITFSAVTLEPTTVHPGDETMLLHVVLNSTFAEDQVLESLTFENATVGVGTGGELDRNLQVVVLREDGNGSRALEDLVTDPSLGSKAFTDGTVTFTGLGLVIPAGASRDLFLTGRISPTEAADGDVVAAVLPDAQSVEFENPVTTAASWPVDSGARGTIDGMLASQITNHGTRVATLGPGEGPVVGLDLTIPGNGYAADVLSSVLVINEGTADDADLAEVRLWLDGGDEELGGTTSDDTDLGPMPWVGGGWQSPLLSEPLPAGGARFFVAFTVASSVTDSATVRFALPVEGLTVASGNDGPIDVAVENPQTFLLSSAPLLVTLEIDPEASTLGRDVDVRMVVRNVGSETIEDIEPTALAASGDDILTLATGPQPVRFDLGLAETDTFTWTYTAAATGATRFVGSASGTGESSGLLRLSLEATSNEHRVFDQADSLILFPVASTPFSVNRGQENVVPLSLTFDNNGGVSASTILVTRLRVGLENESGQGIVPADLMALAEVREGTNVYRSKSSLETSGSEIDLVLDSPIAVTTTEPVTVNLQFTISPATTVPNFRITILDGGWITAQDENNGVTSQIVLGDGVYPVRSGLANVMAEATQVDVAGGSPRGPARVGRGQTDVALLSVALENPGLDGITSDVRVGSFAISVMDTNGTAVGDPQRYLHRIRVAGGLQTFLDRSLIALDDTTLALDLSPQMSLAVNTPLDVSIYGDIDEDAALGPFRIRLLDGTHFFATDANTRNPIPALYATNPIDGPVVVVESPADSILVSGEPAFPPTVNVGETGITALQATLRHPGTPGTARVRCDGVTILCRDEARSPLMVDAYLDRVRILWDDAEIATASSFEAASDRVTVPLPGILLEPGQSGTLTVTVDVEATAPASFLELSVAQTGLACVDANTEGSLLPSPEHDAEFPLASGLTRLEAPARELVVRLESLMPAALVANHTEIPVAGLRLDNTADDGAGSITVEHLTVYGADRDRATVAVGSVARQALLYSGETLLAQSDTLSADSTTAQLTLSPPLLVAPDSDTPLELRLLLRDTTTESSFRLGITGSSVGVLQPTSALLTIAVHADQGREFPLWTEAGNFTAADLAGSFSNFPNPFAAGREMTTFVYNLDQDARVSLRVFSSVGEKVITVLDSQPRSEGVRQEDTWDGRNGNGNTVRNGVYLVQIKVDYVDGRQEELLRKVAVTR